MSQDEPVPVDKPTARDPASVAPSGFSISSAAFAQEQLYTNGGLNYSLRGYGTVGSNQQNAGTAQINGEEMLSYKVYHIMKPEADKALAANIAGFIGASGSLWMHRGNRVQQRWKGVREDGSVGN